MLDTIQQYVSIITAIVGSIVGIIGVSEKPRPQNSGVSGNKVLKLIFAISIVGLLSGTSLSIYNISNSEAIKREYFKYSDPVQKYSFEENQKFQDVFNEKYVRPPTLITGVSILIMAVAFFVRSFSKSNPPIIEFVLEIIFLIFGVFLLI